MKKRYWLLLLQFIPVLAFTQSLCGQFSHCSIVHANGAWAVKHDLLPNVACALARDLIRQHSKESPEVEVKVFSPEDLDHVKLRCAQGDLLVEQRDVQAAVDAAVINRWGTCRLTTE